MDNDLYYLRAVSRRLEEMRDALDMEGEAVSLLGLEALSDELDWLEDFIARQENAAAEIERLTARVAELEDLIDSPIKGLRRTIRLQREMIEDVDHKRQTWRDRAEAAEAERDRLREALVWAGTGPGDGVPWTNWLRKQPDHYEDTLVRARAALGEGK